MIDSGCNSDVFVALTFDVDSDEFSGDGHPPRVAGDKTILGWEGFREGKDIIVDSLNGITDYYGCPPVKSWFVRCDSQVAEEHGTWTYLIDEYRSWWDERIQAGDEIQWHAHLYTRNETGWIQQQDHHTITSELERGKRVLEDSGITPQVIRIGESFFSNELADIIESLGLRADSTALPGRKRKDAEKTIDWETAPNRPYHPSLQDYRSNHSPARNIWEIPMNTVPTRVSYDSDTLLRYVNLAFQPGVLDDGLESFFVNHDVLVTITHPFELISAFFKDSKRTGHPLISYHADSIRTNIQVLLEAAGQSGKKVRFVTMSQLIEQLEV